mmetsp:Transcript_13091/g.52779  ORF Transcript_13091/g.52779 Transcript_13091/m.52779 type:complete len:431 (-) Transcript_13091:130-1422(-)
MGRRVRQGASHRRRGSRDAVRVVRRQREGRGREGTGVVGDGSRRREVQGQGRRRQSRGDVGYGPDWGKNKWGKRRGDDERRNGRNGRNPLEPLGGSPLGGTPGETRARDRSDSNPVPPQVRGVPLPRALFTRTLLRGFVGGSANASAAFAQEGAQGGDGGVRHLRARARAAPATRPDVCGRSNERIPNGSERDEVAYWTGDIRRVQRKGRRRVFAVVLVPERQDRHDGFQRRHGPLARPRAAQSKRRVSPRGPLRRLRRRGHTQGDKRCVWRCVWRKKADGSIHSWRRSRRRKTRDTEKESGHLGGNAPLRRAFPATDRPVLRVGRGGRDDTVPVLHQGAARRGLHASGENQGGVRVRRVVRDVREAVRTGGWLALGRDDERGWGGRGGIRSRDRRVGVRSRGPRGVLPGELLHNRRKGRGRRVRGMLAS